MQRRMKESGFSLMELLIVVMVMGIIMAMNGSLLQDLIRGQRQQAAIVSAQFESALALEILRNDLANAGFGLVDEFQSAPGGYAEAAGNPAQQFNDAPNIPRALAHSNDMSAFATYLVNSDYLVIKSPAVGMNSAAGKWTNISGSTVHVWNDPSLDMATGTDYMIVVKPRSSLGGRSQLIVDSSSGTYALQYTTAPLLPAFAPTGAGERFLAFGVEQGTLPSVPFNRADYYVRSNLTNENCASGTGALIKGVFNHGTKTITQLVDEHPLLECVASMQVVFRLDTNGDGSPDNTVSTIAGLDALTIKEQVKEVQVYILAHEGAMDRGFTYGGANPVTVGPTVALGTSVNLTGFGGSNWNHYRWKLYTLIVKPKSFY